MHDNKNKNKIILPPMGLNISRNMMPQLGHKEGFLSNLKKHGITYKNVHVQPKYLRASQGEFNHDTIHSLINDGEKGAKSAVVISKDNYVIDGHHRWIADFNKNKLTQAIRVDLPALELIKLAKTFKTTHYKDVTDINGGSRNPVKIIKGIVAESSNKYK